MLKHLTMFFTAVLLLSTIACNTSKTKDYPLGFAPCKWEEAKFGAHLVCPESMKPSVEKSHEHDSYFIYLLTNDNIEFWSMPSVKQRQCTLHRVENSIPIIDAYPDIRDYAWQESHNYYFCTEDLDTILPIVLKTKPENKQNAFFAFSALQFPKKITQSFSQTISKDDSSYYVEIPDNLGFMTIHFSDKK